MKFTETGTGSFVMLKFPYDPVAVEEIKQWPGAEWIPARKVWRVSGDLLAAMEDAAALHIIASADTGPTPFFMEPMSPSPPDLMGFQQEGILFAGRALTQYGGALLCDEMGLGKTREALETAKILGCKKILVLCPSIAKGVWEEETAKWWPGSITPILDGLVPDRVFPAATTAAVVVICNYDIVAPRLVSKRRGTAPIGEKQYDTRAFTGWAAALADWKPDMVILDEFRHLKGKRAKKRSAIKEVCGRAKYRLGLDGTPIQERTRDLWSPLDLILPGRFGRTDFRFRVRYGGAYHNGYGWKDPIDEADELSPDEQAALGAHRKELKQRLSRYMIRRLARDVMKELPPLRPIVLPVDIGQHAKSKAELLRATGSLLRASGPQAQTGALVAIEAVLSKAKINATVEQAMELLEQKSHGLIFCHFRESRVAIEAAIRSKGPLRAEGFDGGTPHGRRREIITRWKQQGGALVMTTDTGGQALTLTEASWEIVHDLEWSASKIVQALRRAVRKGQTHPVMIYMMVARGTLDDHKVKAIQAKIKAEDVVVGTAEPAVAYSLGEELESRALFLRRLLAKPAPDEFRPENIDQWMIDAMEEMEEEDNT